MTSKPLVSIIIPVYNGGDYLREAIDSALAQTYAPIEILVVNDGSRDGGLTARIASEYGDSIRYFEKENGGVSSALNCGIRNMRGTYFSWLSHDDLYEPRKVEAQVAALAEEGGKALVYCNFSTIDQNSAPMPDTKASCRLHRDMNPREALHQVLRHGSLNGCGFLIPKAAFDECGGFDEALRYAQDSLMWYRLFAHGWALRVVPDKLVKSRVHANQQTQKNRSKFTADNQAICREMLPVFDRLSTEGDDFVLEYALRSALKGETGNVRACRQKLKQAGRLNASARLRLLLRSAYGRLRPTVRKAYYRLFRRIRTE